MKKTNRIGGLNALQKVKELYPNNKYIVANDTSYTKDGVVKYSKEYESFNKIELMLNMISEDNHVYEVIGKEVTKPYFDIDYLNLTREQTSDFLSDFVNVLSESKLICGLQPSELITLTNDKFMKKNKRLNIPKQASDKIHSLHIIIPNYKIDRKDLKLLVKYLNDKYMDVWDKYTDNDIFDLAIYGKNQQFRMINQSKLEHKIKLVDFHSNLKDKYKKSEVKEFIKSTIVSITTKCQKLKFTMSNMVCDDTSDEDTNNKELIELMEEDVVDFILYNDSLNNKKLLNKPRIWKLILRIIKDTECYDMDKFLKESVIIADNPRYSVELNQQYLEYIKHEKTNADIASLYKLINRESTKYKVYSNSLQVPSHTKEFLKKYWEEQSIQIIETLIRFNTGDDKEYCIYDLDSNKVCVYKEHYDLKNKLFLNTGFIIDHRKELPNDICNIFCDNIPIPQEELFNSVQNISEAQTELTKFCNDDTKNVFVLKSKWSTGKTYHIINNLIDKYKDTHKILMITESNSLNNKLSKEFGFVSHTDDAYKSPNRLHYEDRVVCSIQSLHRVDDGEFPIIVLDEIQSVLNAFSSTTTFMQLPKHLKAYNMYNLLISKIQTSIKSVLCDADIQETYIDEIVKQTAEHNTTIIKNEELVFQDYDFIIHTNLTTFVDTSSDKIINEDCNIAFASASKKKADDYLVAINQIISKQHKKDIVKKKPTPFSKNVLILTQDGVGYYTNGVKHNLPINDKLNKIAMNKPVKHLKEFVIQNIDDVIEECDVNIFIYTPTIKTGISINIEHFKYVFAVGECRSIVYYEFLQMLFRVRKVMGKIVYIYLSLFEFKNRTNVSISQTKNLQQTNSNIFKKLTKKFQHFDMADCGESYSNIQTISLNNLQNTKYNYANNFISLLKYHQLNYSYDITKLLNVDDDECDENTEEAMKLDMAKSALINKISSYEKWKATPIMGIVEYFSIREQMKTNSKLWSEILSDDSKQSYSKTKNLYTIFNINQNNTEDFCEFIYNEDDDKELVYKDIINTETQNWIETCENLDFFNKYIYSKNYNNIYKIRHLWSDDFQYDDNIQDDMKDKNIKILNVREILQLFNLLSFENKSVDASLDTFKSLKPVRKSKQTKLNFKKVACKKVVKFESEETTTIKFNPVVINYNDFIKTVTSDSTIDKTKMFLQQKFFKQMKCNFNITSKYHRKVIYNQIKECLNFMDLDMKLIGRLDRANCKIKIFQRNTFFKYNTEQTERKVSKSIINIKDESTPNTIDTSVKLSNKLYESIHNKLMNGEMIDTDNDKRTLKKYIQVCLASELYWEVDDHNGYLIQDVPKFYNQMFDICLTNDGKIKLYSKIYDIETNLKKNQEFITMDKLTSSRNKLKIDIYKTDVNTFEEVIPLTSEKVYEFIQKKSDIHAPDKYYYRWLPKWQIVLKEIHNTKMFIAVKKKKFIDQLILFLIQCRRETITKLLENRHESESTLSEAVVFTQSKIDALKKRNKIITPIIEINKPKHTAIKTLVRPYEYTQSKSLEKLRKRKSTESPNISEITKSIHRRLYY